jgi:hypothetical protein
MEVISLEAGIDHLHRLLLVQGQIPSIRLESCDAAQLMPEFMKQYERAELGRTPRPAERS